MTDASVLEPISVDEFHQTAQAILDEVGKVIVGQQTVSAAGADVHRQWRPCAARRRARPGKTMLIRTLAEVLDLKFSRIQFTPDLMPADIIGTNIMDGRGRAAHLPSRPGRSSPTWCSPTINRATPKTQSALLEAMQEKTVTVANARYLLAPPFFVLATQNPIEQEGTYPLPEAQLDRFLFKVDVLFPSAGDLVEIMGRTTGVHTPRPEKVADGARILAMGDLARQVPVASHVSQYIAQLVVATHPEESSAADGLVQQYVRYGASPRGAQALVLGAKVSALLAGRYNVAFEDVQAVAHAALRHRLLLNFEGLAEGIRTDDVIDDLLARVPVPAGA